MLHVVRDNVEMLLDTLNQRGAQELASRIIDYWYRRGYDVTVDILPDALFGDRIWVVRSNMINGMPVRRH